MITNATDPLVTVIINNFNYAKFVRLAIESVALQTWPRVETIVIDDASTDSSIEEIERFPVGQLIKRESNGGQGVAISEAFASSSGDIIVFLDSDDVLHADVLTQVVDAFRSYPDAARVQWPLRVIDESGTPTGRVTPAPAMMPSGDLRDHMVRYRTHVWPATSGNSYPRWALEQVMPVPSEFRWGSDLYLCETTALLGPVVSLSAPGADYRVHSNNNWSTRHIDVDNIRQRIRWTEQSHAHVRKLGRGVGIEIPADSGKALDVAFASQRLALKRMNSSDPLIETATRAGLLIHGLRAAVVHPHHTPMHKLKRVVWLLGVGLGPKRIADGLIQRFYGAS